MQQECFAGKNEMFKKTITVPNESKLSGLLLFLDRDGITRAKGKVRKAHVEYQPKHLNCPHSQHWTVWLFLGKMDKTWLHDGDDYMGSVVKRKFRTLGFENALRSVERDCAQGRKMERTMDPNMSDLPATTFRLEDLVNPFRFFEVDYCGPFQVKQVLKSLETWICLFTYLSTKTVRLGEVSTLDTQSGLNSYRFVLRWVIKKRFRQISVLFSYEQLENSVSFLPL